MNGHREYVRRLVQAKRQEKVNSSSPGLQVTLVFLEHFPFGGVDMVLVGTNSAQGSGRRAWSVESRP